MQLASSTSSSLLLVFFFCVAFALVNAVHFLFVSIYRYHYWLLYRLPENPDPEMPPGNQLIAPVGKFIFTFALSCLGKLSRLVSYLRHVKAYIQHQMVRVLLDYCVQGV